MMTRIAGVSRAPLFAAALVIVLLAGCSVTVAGQAVRTPPTGDERALPNPAELERVMHLPMESDGVAQVGGMDTLRDGQDVAPVECAGVTHAGYRQTYQGAPLRGAALGWSKTPQRSDDRVNVAVAVVELNSAHDAQSWYAKTSERWRQCEDSTVTERTKAVSFIENIGRVSDSDGQLTAELSVSTDNGLMMPAQNWRAFYATSRYLVDVEVFGIFGHQEHFTNDAIAVAELVAEKITKGQ